MRDALPNATFVGFTGTPIDRDDRSTPRVFGSYADIYDIRQAVQDGATVPIYYESHVIKLTINTTALDEAEREIVRSRRPTSMASRLPRTFASRWRR